MAVTQIRGSGSQSTAILTRHMMKVHKDEMREKREQDEDEDVDVVLPLTVAPIAIASESPHLLSSHHHLQLSPINDRHAAALRRRGWPSHVMPWS